FELRQLANSAHIFVVVCHPCSQQDNAEDHDVLRDDICSLFGSIPNIFAPKSHATNERACLVQQEGQRVHFKPIFQNTFHLSVQRCGFGHKSVLVFG
ncbi:MAG: hypothetical protein PHY48_13060, partial [Candidatus Cloacimonetes bacterium]|nr:hypothetical protein [Candidatus Cloacimonadota bacterium]